MKHVVKFFNKLYSSIDMATSSYSNIDEYGFERASNFNYEIHDEFMSRYLKILANRSKKWTELLRNTQKPKKNNTLKRYVRKGVPGEHRKVIWLYVSGAEALMNSKPELYTLLKQLTPKKSIIEIVKTDIPRTFPENIFFSQSVELPEQLFNVLVAYAHHNTEVGYCQGLNYIVGLLLIVTKSEEASFWLLKCIVEQILPKYYIKTMAGLITEIEVLSQLVLLKEPEIYKHLQNLGLPWAVVTTKWFICLFAEVLPTETVLRIWDCLFNEGSKILFRVALTLMKTYKQQILECTDLASIVDCFKRIVKEPYVVKCHDFMEEIFKVPGSLSNKLIQRLRIEYADKSSSD